MAPYHTLGIWHITSYHHEIPSMASLGIFFMILKIPWIHMIISSHSHHLTLSCGRNITKWMASIDILSRHFWCIWSGFSFSSHWKRTILGRRIQFTLLKKMYRSCLGLYMSLPKLNQIKPFICWGCYVRLFENKVPPKSTENCHDHPQEKCCFCESAWSLDKPDKPTEKTNTGWWCNNHLEKYESQWEGLSPYIMENKKCLKPPTSISLVIYPMTCPPSAVPIPIINGRLIISYPVLLIKLWTIMCLGNSE